MEKLTRKEFLQRAAAAGLAASAWGQLAGGPATAAEGVTVVLVSSPRAIRAGGPDQAVVKAMVDKAVATLTGKPVLAAWKSLFRPSDVVGIKVNTITGPRLSTRPEVAMAVARGAVAAGVKPENVIIFDRMVRELAVAGFTVNPDGPGIRCIGIGDDWDPEPTTSGRFRGPLARLLSSRLTALVNVPVLKDHCDAGITFALKNHFGCVANAPEQHRDYHGTIADLNAVPAIRSKTRLVLGDCLYGMANGGPPYQTPDQIWEPKAVLASLDPVAADAVAWQVIEEGRQAKGLPTLAAAGREPKSIALAAAAGLGAADPAKIKVVKVTL